MQRAFSVVKDLSKIREEFEKVRKLSEYLNFPFTSDEVADYFLPGINITGEQLRSMIFEGSFPDVPITLRGGYIITSATQSESSRQERERISAAKLDSATGFATVLKRLIPFIRTIAVTGSVAYGSADQWDDIDLFIVTKRNRLWLTAFLTLILVRLNKLLGLRPSHLLPFCLSYVHDEEGFATESQKNRANSLFARELLKAKPVAGPDEYRKILEENDWVGRFYSSSYATKLRGLHQGNGGQVTKFNGGLQSLSALLDWAEGIAFAFLSRYLYVRAYLTNLKLESEGHSFRVFQPKMSAGSCIYTSHFYEWLRGLWGN